MISASRARAATRPSVEKRAVGRSLSLASVVSTMRLYLPLPEA